MNSIRVLHIADFAAPYKGNFLPSLWTLRQELRKNNGEMILVLPQRAQQREWFEGFRKEFDDQVVLMPPAGTISQLRFLRSLCRSHRINIMHTHFIQYDMVAYAAAMLSGAKIVWHCHSDWAISLNPLRLLKDFIKHRILGLNAYHIAVSDNVKNTLLKRQAYKSRTEVIFNGIELGRIPSRIPDKNNVKRRLGIDESAFIFTMFAWAPHIKGLDIALDALSCLSKSDLEKLQFVVVGREQTESFLKDKASELYPNKIKLVAPLQNVFELFAATDCFCSFSRSEGFPYSMCEAMGFGNVVLANDIPALKPLHNSDAIFFMQNNASDAAEKMRMILDMPLSERERISNANSEFVKKNYNASVWAKQIVEMYKKLA